MCMVEVTRFELATPSSRTMYATKLRYTSMLVKNSPEKIIFGAILWLWNRDSNPNKQSQSLSCYRYTIPQNIIATERATVIIIGDILENVNRICKFFSIFFLFLYPYLKNQVFGHFH